MRCAFLAVLTVTLGPAVALAQTGPYITTVADPEVKLRAGPSDTYPETATLIKGTQLFVDHEEPNGWLAVQDVPGSGHSISWVQMQFVDFNPSKPTPQRVMTTDPTTLRAGQMGVAQPLEVGRAKVPAGTALRVIGPKVEFQGRSWYPVEPPAGDFRYLPRHTVKFDKAINMNFTVRDGVSPVSPAGGTTPAAAPSGSGTLPAVSVGRTGSVDHPLWAEADAAERSGRYDDAERLYFKLAAIMNQPGGDHDIANLCYTKIHTLRERKRSVATSGTTGSRPVMPEPARPASGKKQPDDGSNPQAAEPGDDRPRWNGPGLLVLSAIALDGRKTYLLETSAGVANLYVVPAPGVNLDRYVGKRVEVHGVTHTRAGLKKPFVVATTVEMVQ